MQAWNLQTYGAGKDRWKEYYAKRRKENLKSLAILGYFGLVVLAYVIAIMLGV